VLRETCFNPREWRCACHSRRFHASPQATMSHSIGPATCATIVRTAAAEVSREQASLNRIGRRCTSATRHPRGGRHCGRRRHSTCEGAGQISTFVLVAKIMLIIRIVPYCSQIPEILQDGHFVTGYSLVLKPCRQVRSSPDRSR
jgi:hypothetical protein